MSVIFLHAWSAWKGIQMWVLFLHDQRRVLLVLCVFKTKKKIGNIIGHVWCRRTISWSSVCSQTRAEVQTDLSPFAWIHSVRWMRMKARHVLRQSALFKPNHCNWSYYLQLYFKIIIYIFSFCNGKVSWAMNCRFVRNIDHCK